MLQRWVERATMVTDLWFTTFDKDRDDKELSQSLPKPED
jgi:hypothetical protein